MSSAFRRQSFAELIPPEGGTPNRDAMISNGLKRIGPSYLPVASMEVFDQHEIEVEFLQARIENGALIRRNG